MLNHQSGATALTSFFIGLDGTFAGRTGRKDIKQLSDIYLFHQPTGAFSAQSPYVNLSVFDRHYLHGLYGHFRNDGSGIDEDSVQKLQRMHAEWITEEVEKRDLSLHFVLTACLLLDENKNIRDEEFLDWLSS